jgi:hypothetical protein
MKMDPVNQSLSYLEPTQESGRAFMMRQMTGSVVMLNLLRFRETRIIPRRCGGLGVR